MTKNLAKYRFFFGFFSGWIINNQTFQYTENKGNIKPISSMSELCVSVGL